MKNKICLWLPCFLILFNLGANAQKLEKVAYQDGDKKLNGFISLPKNSNKKKAGVLIIPAWMGIDAHAQASADKLAAAGYYTFIADIYGEGNYPNGDPKKAREMSSYYKSHTDEYIQRIRFALETFINKGVDPGNIVIIGYCFGGTGALDAAREGLPVKGVISFHGGLARDTTKAIGPIPAKVLVCHGASDPYVKEAEVKAFQNEMNQSKADWQMIYYANAVHAFTDPEAGNDPSKGAAYNEKADKRSWALMMQFLAEAFD